MNGEILVSTKGETDQQKKQMLVDSSVRRYEGTVEFAYPLDGDENEMGVLQMHELVQICGSAIIKIQNEKILTAVLDKHHDKANRLIEKAAAGEYDIEAARKRGEAALNRIGE